MPGAKAAVSQNAFVAVDHWRGDGDGGDGGGWDAPSCFLLLSGRGASAAPWRRERASALPPHLPQDGLRLCVSEQGCACVCVCVPERDTVLV